MRQLEQRLEEPKLRDHLERRRVDGVATKVSQEVGVLLQHDDVDARPREQQAEHHARRSATRDTDLVSVHLCSAYTRAAGPDRLVGGTMSAGLFSPASPFPPPREGGETSGPA